MEANQKWMTEESLDIMEERRLIFKQSNQQEM